MEAVDRELELLSDGIKLKGRMFSVNGAGTLVVLIHGLPLSRPDPSDGGYPELIGRIAARGLSTLFVNLRGTGDSGGNFHLGGWYRDIEAILDFTRDELKKEFERVLVVGFSTGGALAIRYAGLNQWLDGVATLAAPARFSRLFPREGLEGFLQVARDVGIIRDPDFPRDPEEFYSEVKECEAIEYVGGISPAPLLVVHGEKDETIPVQEGIELFLAAGEPREITLLPGGTHRLRKDEHAIQSVLNWAHRVSGGGLG